MLIVVFDSCGLSAWAKKKKKEKKKEVRMQYVQIWNIVDTSISIKHQISGQCTSMLKGYMYMCFDILDAPFSYGRALIVC